MEGVWRSHLRDGMRVLDATIRPQDRSAAGSHREIFRIVRSRCLSFLAGCQTSEARILDMAVGLSRSRGVCRIRESYAARTEKHFEDGGYRWPAGLLQTRHNDGSVPDHRRSRMILRSLRERCRQRGAGLITRGRPMRARSAAAAA